MRRCGADYEIDLNKKNADAFRTQVASFTSGQPETGLGRTVSALRGLAPFAPMRGGHVAACSAAAAFPSQKSEPRNRFPKGYWPPEKGRPGQRHQCMPRLRLPTATKRGGRLNLHADQRR